MIVVLDLRLRRPSALVWMEPVWTKAQLTLDLQPNWNLMADKFERTQFIQAYDNINTLSSAKQMLNNINIQLCLIVKPSKDCFVEFLPTNLEDNTLIQRRHYIIVGNVSTINHSTTIKHMELGYPKTL